MHFLVNGGRLFIFTIRPSPLTAATTRVALEISKVNMERRDRLARLVQFVGNEFHRRCGIKASRSHILPIIVGADQAAVAIAGSSQRRGFEIRAIREPAVTEQALAEDMGCAA